MSKYEELESKVDYVKTTVISNHPGSATVSLSVYALIGITSDASFVGDATARGVDVTDAMNNAAEIILQQGKYFQRLRRNELMVAKIKAALAV
jgi:hypothetical protein